MNTSQPPATALHRRRWFFDLDPMPPPAVTFDLLADVLLPITLCLMLGSLVWFLVDVRAAKVPAPVALLRWVLGFFMLAVVGIARIRARGSLTQAAPLALALLFAMGLFGWFYAFGGGALGGGYGGSNPLWCLLYNYALIAFIWVSANFIVHHTTIDPDDVAVVASGLLSSNEWAEKGEKAQAVRRRPHPGRAVMVLSAAATFLFGAGQRVLGNSPAAEHHAFVCVVVYATCALATLAMTALTGLQLYARCRGARMPAVLPTLWLMVAAPLIVIVLLLAQCSPRVAPQPDSWLPKITMRSTGGEEGAKSRHAGPAEGAGKQQSDRKTGEQGKTPGEKKPEAGGKKAGEKADDDKAGPGGKEGGDDDKEGEGKEGDKGKGGQESKAKPPPGTQPAHVRPPSAPFDWMALVKGVLVLLLVLLLGAVVVLLARQLARLRPRARAASASTSQPRPPTRNPFVDPFGPRSPLRGAPPAEVVRHVYRAFQAWCALCGVPRPPEMTARAFLAHLPTAADPWRAEIEELTLLYEVAEYTPEGVDESCYPQLRACWERLMTAVDKVRG
jgi:hypothetical protein